MDLRWRLDRQDEFELIQEELVDFLGLGVALHSQLATVGGRYGHVEHLNLGESRQNAAGTQAGGSPFVVFLQSDVEAVGKKADEDVGLDALVVLVVDGPEIEIALESAEAFFNAHEVHVVFPEDRRVFAGEVAAQKILTFPETCLPEFLAIEFESKDRGAILRIRGWKDKFHEAVGRTTGFLFGRTDGQKKFVAGDGPAGLKFPEAFPVGFEFPLTHGPFFGATRKAAGQHVEFVPLREKLDGDVVFDVLPLLGGELLLELAQAPFGRCRRDRRRRGPRHASLRGRLRWGCPGP